MEFTRNYVNKNLNFTYFSSRTLFSSVSLYLKWVHIADCRYFYTSAVAVIAAIGKHKHKCGWYSDIQSTSECQIF